MKTQKRKSALSRKIKRTAKTRVRPRTKPKKEIAKLEVEPTIAIVKKKKEHVKSYEEIEGEKDKARAELRQRAIALRYPKNCKLSKRHVRPLLLIPPMGSPEIHLGFVPVIFENDVSDKIAIAQPGGKLYEYWRMFFPKDYENAEDAPAVPTFDSPETAMETWANGTPTSDDSLVRIPKEEK